MPALPQVWACEGHTSVDFTHHAPHTLSKYLFTEYEKTEVGSLEAPCVILIKLFSVFEYGFCFCKKVKIVESTLSIHREHAPSAPGVP
jgi:hypothetical protein